MPHPWRLDAAEPSSPRCRVPSDGLHAKGTLRQEHWASIMQVDCAIESVEIWRGAIELLRVAFGLVCVVVSVSPEVLINDEVAQSHYTPSYSR